MTVKVHLKLGDEEKVIEVQEGTTIKMLRDGLEPKWRNSVLILVNGKIPGEEVSLVFSNRVSILPLLAGG